MKGEKMIFPLSPYEFLLDYSIKDEKEVYTNGALLIPTFRAKQAFEHYFEKQSKWIPVSERLPEDNIHVLCQFYLGGMGECYLAHGVFHVVGGLVMTCNEVVAWMPLPQQYKTESEEDVCKDCYYNDGEVHAECVICDKAESNKESDAE